MEASTRIGIFFLGVALGVFLVGMPILGGIFFSSRNEVLISNQIISVDVMQTSVDRAKGLSGRTGLGTNEGMLFLFEDSYTYGFWMKEMKFPIDIVWISGTTIVGFEENVDPQIGAPESQLRIYYPPRAVDKVLELSAGRIQLLRAQIGDTVKIKRSFSISNL